MNILIAPDSFKGSLSAVDFCCVVAQQFERLCPDVHLDLMPLADGGEGIMDAILSVSPGKKITLSVLNPLAKPVKAQYAILQDRHTAVIEMAQASGLPLITPSVQTISQASSYGTGELIIDALNRGCRRFIMGLGGSATNDSGAGMLAALGIKFYDKRGDEVNVCGQSLSSIQSIDLRAFEPRLCASEFIIASDVSNPLVGKNGATFVYGTQKGADERALIVLENGIKHFARLSEQQLSIESSLQFLPGSGAAGGMGFALLAYCQATMCSGFELLANMTQLDKLLENKQTRPDMIISGEGCFDQQSLSGKVLGHLYQRAQQYQIPLTLICGSQQADFIIKDNHLKIYTLLHSGVSLQYSMNHGAALIKKYIIRIIADICRC